nr:immunoglobulin light chain junction region [Mus musculus]NSL98553.1 immunoglobulin light chain junction region [Mus musculus]NSM00261.1 immunoglobulin light chain junction region [Mus musculus]NSM01014.1 immunoglobulin light chain junction region [Mus musculus]NSM01900.1 immunoglobulin light chain junction region [Mus musculus]
CQNVLSTPLTF